MIHVDDFEQLSDEQIVEHAAMQDVGEVQPDWYGPTVLKSVREGHAVIEKRKYGYAIIHPIGFVDVLADGAPSRRKRTILEVLFLSPQFRRTSTIDSFLAELKQRYQKRPIYLLCHETWRRDFFIKHGFIVLTEPEPGLFEMEFASQDR